MGIDNSLQTVLLILAVTLFVIRFIYWKVTEIQADRDKPKQGNFHRRQRITFTGTMMIVLFFQVIGVEIVPFEQTTAILLLGIFLVFLGFFFSMLGRYSLGTNWAHALEYQIKKKQELVTRGIYRFIRHPIYSGFFLSIIGLELVLGSYLSIVVLVIGIFVLNRQAGMEEKILLEHFGKKYLAYKEKTTRFIPLLW